MALSIFRQQLIDRIFAEESGRCRYCRIAVHKNYFSNKNNDDDATADHIIPRAKRGTNDRANLALACRRCNHAKGDRDLADFLADPRSAAERKLDSRTHIHRRRVTFVPVPALKIMRGTLAAAIQNGEVTEHGTYRRRPPPSTVPGCDPRPRGRKMSAAETAQWLRESAERKGKPWPLA